MKLHAQHWTDENGNPMGGLSFATGFNISWQNGPMQRDGERLPQNGAFVEEIIKAAIDRIEYYQKSKFECSHNAKALDYLRSALDALNTRTLEREEKGVEGTHEV